MARRALVFLMSGQECWRSFQAAVEARERSGFEGDTWRTFAVSSLHIVQDCDLHSTGFLLPKSTSLRGDDGSFVDIN